MMVTASAGEGKSGEFYVTECPLKTAAGILVQFVKVAVCYARP